jgi:hypothetical protein
MKNPLLDDLNEPSIMVLVEIALPTLAAFYPQGEVLRAGADPANLSISPLSVLDESSFRDPLMMLSGHAVGRMVRRVCPDVEDSGCLTDLDVQAILIASRMASYGSDLKLEHTCTNCGTKTELVVDLNEHINRYSPFTPDQFEHFDLFVEQTGQAIRLRPMLYQDAIDMTMTIVRSNIQAEQFDITHVGDTNTLTDEFVEAYRKQFDANVSANLEAMCAAIYHVTTKTGKVVTDRNLIREWVLKLPTDIVGMITKRIGEINHDIRERSRLSYTCANCGGENSFYMELDPQKLFTRPEGSEKKMNFSGEPKPIEKPTKRPSRVSRK